MLTIKIFLFILCSNLVEFFYRISMIEAYCVPFFSSFGRPLKTTYHKKHGADRVCFTHHPSSVICSSKYNTDTTGGMLINLILVNYKSKEQCSIIFLTFLGNLNLQKHLDIFLCMTIDA